MEVQMMMVMKGRVTLYSAWQGSATVDLKGHLIMQISESTLWVDKTQTLRCHSRNNVLYCEEFSLKPLPTEEIVPMETDSVEQGHCFCKETWLLIFLYGIFQGFDHNKNAYLHCTAMQKTQRPTAQNK